MPMNYDQWHSTYWPQLGTQQAVQWQLANPGQFYLQDQMKSQGGLTQAQIYDYFRYAKNQDMKQTWLNPLTRGTLTYDPFWDYQEQYLKPDFSAGSTYASPYSFGQGALRGDEGQGVTFQALPGNWNQLVAPTTNTNAFPPDPMPITDTRLPEPQRATIPGQMPGREIGAAAPPAGGIRSSGYNLTDVLNQNRQRTIPEYRGIGSGNLLDRVLRMRQSGY